MAHTPCTKHHCTFSHSRTLGLVKVKSQALISQLAGSGEGADSPGQSISLASRRLLEAPTGQLLAGGVWMERTCSYQMQVVPTALNQAPALPPTTPSGLPRGPVETLGRRVVRGRLDWPSFWLQNSG